MLWNYELNDSAGDMLVIVSIGSAAASGSDDWLRYRFCSSSFATGVGEVNVLAQHHAPKRRRPALSRSILYSNIVGIVKARSKFIVGT